MPILTRQCPSDIQTTSSLPVSPPPAAEAEEGPSTPTQSRGQPGSPALSTSSTAEAGSSPILPGLPAPTLNGRTIELLNTPPSGSRTNSSQYYTASWGSPYPQPPPGESHAAHSYAHSNTLSSEPSEDSPIRHLDFHTPYLRPPPTFTRQTSDPDFVSQDGLISAAVLANRARRPAQGLTEDWIRQHTGGESGEANHWLSDDPGDSEHSSLSGSISGDNRQEADPRTPTLQRFLDSREEARSSKRRHGRKQSTATLKQEDFSDSVLPSMSDTMGNAASAGIKNATSSPFDERPPTPPPKQEWSTSALAAEATPKFASTTPSVPSPPRVKKKVPWKGKNIMVLLPRDDKRGQKGDTPNPMTEKDVEAKLKKWEDQGYDTSGFNLGQGGNVSGYAEQGQSCALWPQIEDVREERQQRSFRVSIPDRREWDNYVQDLQEAKLRALGVSLGDEEPPPLISPAVSNLSRQASTVYPSLPFSPPVPTSSGASQAHNPFSPALIPGAGISATQSSNPGSIASPASMHAHLQGKFNPRQSVSFPAGEFGSPYPQHSPGVWSPQQMLYHQGAPQGGSPSLQNPGAGVSPTSPFSQDGYFQGDVMSQLQQRQQLLQKQLQQQQQQQLQLQASAKASPRLQEVHVGEDEETPAPSKSPSKTPEARQVKHNPSASFQKEIDDAEYHLEEQFQRQLEHEDYNPHFEVADKAVHVDSRPQLNHNENVSAGHKGLSASMYADDDEAEPVLYHPQPHSRGHSLSQHPFQDQEDTSSAAESKSGLQNNKSLKAELSDMETNPSNMGTPVQNNSLNGHDRSLSTSSNPWASEPSQTDDSKPPRRPSHSTKPSTSKLNVAAKEFKFDPTSSFKPGQFAFGGGANNFQPPPVTSIPAFAPPHSATSSHFSNQSLGSSMGKFNVAAPAFTPGQSEFSFSAGGPSFRPDSKAFTPSNGTFSDSVASLGSGTEDPVRASIFGSIDLGAIGASKPAKKSKAIPIVRPDSSHSRASLPRNLEDELMEGKDGRITQGEGRIKRARGGKDDGNSVPLFAEPSMPLSETSREQSPPKETIPAVAKPADKENSAPPSAEIDRAPTVPPKSHARNATNVSEVSPISPDQPAQDFGPFEFQEQKQAEDYNAARPFTSRRYAYGFDAPLEDEVSAEELASPASKSHKKNTSSLSAAAKPFEFKPGPFNFTFGEPSEPKAAMDTPPTLPGLSGSRFAESPTPPPQSPSPEVDFEYNEAAEFQNALPGPESPPGYNERMAETADREPTYEEIDDIMNHLNQAEFESAPRDSSPGYIQPSPIRQIQMPNLEQSSPIRLQPQNLMRSEAPSPSSGRFMALPGEPVASQRIFSRPHDDPFVEESPPPMPFISPSPIHRLNRGSDVPASDWDDVLSETEELKLQPRARFFDSHVNDLVGGLLAERLDPLERTLDTIQMSLDMMSGRAPSSRRERRSISGALSDADDEDDDNPRRSLSPRRDKKLDKIRSVVLEALNAHQSSRPPTASAEPQAIPDSQNVLQVLEEMKEHFGQSMRLDFRADDLRNIVEDAVEKRMPPSPNPMVEEAAVARDAEQRARITDLEERLRIAEAKPLFDEAAAARDADQKIKIIELEERLSRADTRSEEEIQNRRAAEDRLAEVQRLLRISSEEEDRLREAMEEREVKIREIVDGSDQKVRNIEEQRAKTTMRIALLEAGQNNAQKTQSDLQNRINIAEADLRQSRQAAQHWQMEAERALEAAKRHSEDAEAANETNQALRRNVDSLRTQMEESIRVREGMRGKLMDLQEDMAQAARDISQENARRAKREQELVARQEVLDARLQAEARTRERLEQECERLEGGEREGMRAVSECKKLEGIVAELRLEGHNAQKEVMRYQREFEEARESGLSEVQRTRRFMQAELEAANNQVNVVREDLENQVLRLRAEIDQVKLDADTAKEQHEMLLEEANNSKQNAVYDVKRKHADKIEDLQTQHERQLGNAIEDAQRSEQHLLERLSLSSSKTEHLQDRVQHLEERLEIANEAANAAAKAARSASGSVPVSLPQATTLVSMPQQQQQAVSHAMELPEKISPQVFRESIMVLQEQLQDREQKVEMLEATLATLDVDAPTKISKRDDEIMWLRELLAVRKGDLQDIVTSISSENFNPEQLKDAAIRLSANLQMEEQERERAMNGGSAISLPNIAASLRDAATPRVAQAVGPLAAAWGNWRKSRDSDAGIGSRSSTPSKQNPSRHNPSPSTQSFLGGLLTPPASTAPRVSAQPTAFGNTGQRFTSAQLANRPRNMTPKKQGKTPEPRTPPMMRKSSYDPDAADAQGFSDAGFYDDDESTVDDGYGSGGGPLPLGR
ncbi:hypothetical protein LOCC1_G001217 [Lachnellula occidentalis]|uniref:Myosin class II heavy chain n=1 Tax=Lachnellula occidentalis TaxID=215460 RepID=A0A8H8UKH7_9HELO|nr:hypothetical protein LOCC1_G001217 [Lachnellula occidentalis]